MTPQEHNPDQNPDQGFSGAEELLKSLEQSDTAEPGERDIRQTLAERHPDWPKVKIEFYFGSHATAKDFAGLKDKLDGADIYFYEDVGGHRDVQEARQQMADAQPIIPGAAGREIWKQALTGRIVRGGANEAIIRAIHGSGKVVESFDLLEDDPVNDDDIDRSWDRTWWTVDNFDEALTSMDASSQEVARLQKQREEIMEERLEERLAEILERRPELKSRPEIKVLSTLGTVHTGLYHELERKGEDVSRDFAPGNRNFSHQDELIRAHLFDREPSKDLLAKAYTEAALGAYLKKTFNGRDFVSSDYDTYMRAVSGKFEMNDSARLHETILAGQRLDKDVTAEVLSLAERVSGMGPTPKDGKELHEQAQQIRELAT